MIRTFGILSVVTLFTLTGSLDHRRDCHPSQYWDGEKCRHKGKGKKKGKGHRKHHHH